MKYIIYILFLLFSINIIGQRIRPFIGGAVYLHTDFERSTFVNFSLGSEIKVVKFLRSEIEVSYMFGTLQEVIIRDKKGLTMSISEKSASAMNYSFCPKIVIGDYEENSDYLQILPRYTFSRIEAKRELASRNLIDLSKPIKERQNVLDSQHSFGIGVGYFFNFPGEYSNSLALNLYYNGVNLGKALNKLNPDGYKYGTQDVMGLGINFYLGLKKNK